MLGYIHDVQDFVDAHYLLSARRDSEFWRYQTSRKYPERLMHRLALYAAEMPNASNRVKSFAWAFNEVSWLDILNGYGFKYAKVDGYRRSSAFARRAGAAANCGKAKRQAVDPQNFTARRSELARRPGLALRPSAGSRR